MNSFDSRSQIEVDNRSITVYNPLKVPGAESLPYSIKILLENLLRHEDGDLVSAEHIEALVRRHPRDVGNREIAFQPARVLMQDFTGVPALVDLAAMRQAMADSGKNPEKINPLKPTELVIDHSVQVDVAGNDKAFDLNRKIEFSRNKERYQFLKWGQNAFSNLKIVPPGSGIVHQVNIEYLARVVFCEPQGDTFLAYPDTVVGTDSHTTMVNGIGVLGWGVGGIEAEASMLGQAISMLIPRVVGFELTGKLPEGSTATDLVLIIVNKLRSHGVVGKFVEFYGSGLAHLPLADRCTIANMAPEYGATCGIFPIDHQTLNYLRLTGRDQNQVHLIESYSKETGLWNDDQVDLKFDENLKLDLSTVVPTLAGPKRPQDTIQLHEAKKQFHQDLPTVRKSKTESIEVNLNGGKQTLHNGSLAIAAITSCTNTSNPSVMIAAGLLARKAVEKGLRTKPWVKTSLAPGSLAVMDYLEKGQLIEPLKVLGFHNVGYGCTTCIGNSGPLAAEIESALAKNPIAISAILSGNRNFEGRIHPRVQMNYLASPPLVVAYALAGTMDFDMYQDALGQDAAGNPIYLKDIWPTSEAIMEVETKCLSPEQFNASYSKIFDGDEQWQALNATHETFFDWPPSTYIALPPYFDSNAQSNGRGNAIQAARVLAMLGDSVTTDHISPAGSIAVDSPAGKFLIESKVEPQDFNSYGSRRGNHHVMMRGTFANIRLNNFLVPDIEGGYTRVMPGNEVMPIYDAAMHYQQEKIPMIVLAGKEYGSGSSRDWGAKGPFLQGVQAIIAESFERIHRSNLIGMGILPLQYQDGESAQSLGLTGEEVFDIDVLPQLCNATLEVRARADSGNTQAFQVRTRIDTPREEEYYRSGGILQYVLDQF